MNFINELEARIFQLEEIIQNLEAKLQDAPQGSVHIYHSGKRTQYYLHDNNEIRYMKVQEMPEVVGLCQKDYDKKVLEAARKEWKDLQKIQRKYPKESWESIYARLHEQRKKLIQPIWLPEEEYVQQWEGQEYPQKGFHNDMPEFYSDRGERVRSKSEILIANALLKHKIPYRYEAPLHLAGFGTIHPDFTVLNVRLRKEMYWEHLGMMDNEEYCEHALDRIDAYERNQLFPGDALILTHESQRKPIHSKKIEAMIQKFLV